MDPGSWPLLLLTSEYLELYLWKGNTTWKNDQREFSRSSHLSSHDAISDRSERTHLYNRTGRLQSPLARRVACVLARALKSCPTHRKQPILYLKSSVSLRHHYDVVTSIKGNKLRFQMDKMLLMLLFLFPSIKRVPWKEKLPLNISCVWITLRRIILRDWPEPTSNLLLLSWIHLETTNYSINWG